MTTDSTPTPAEPIPFKPETWPVDADGFTPDLCTECGTPVRYGSRHTKCAPGWRATPAAAETAQPAAPEPPRFGFLPNVLLGIAEELEHGLNNEPRFLRQHAAKIREAAAALFATQAQPATHAEVLTQRQHAAGAALSNCAFNLAQRRPGQFTARDIEALDKCRREWDAASAAARTTVKPAPASLDESRVELAAKAIFEHWAFGAPVAWVDGGNSDMQDRARRFARAALAESAHAAANAANRATRTPEQDAAMAASLADLQSQHDADMRADYEHLNCPACAGSGHIDDLGSDPLQAFTSWLARLPVGQRVNVQSAYKRGESVTADAYFAGWAAGRLLREGSEPKATTEGRGAEPAEPGHEVARPEDPWRQAVDAALVSAGLDCLAPDADPAGAVTSLIENAVAMALDPAISECAQALIERGQASAPQVVEPLTEKFGYIRHYLHETARFASLAPRARENINTALELLGELEASISPKKEG